jgi:capsular exopolysaccharide synthesis family protein
MDKLEKALEKARLERQANAASRIVESAPAVQPLPPVASVAPTAARQARTKRTAAEEAILENSRVVSHRTRHRDADAFRMLRTQVLQHLAASGRRSMAITSPHYGDGKSTISSNLALSIAQDVKHTVLLVDLDLRKPDIYRYLGLKTDVGLSDHLIDDVPLEKCIVQSPFDRLAILPGGKPVDNSSELLGSPKMAALVKELEKQPDRLVIYDMPPLLDQDDSMVFFPHVGGVLLVVRDGVTKTADVKRTFSALSNTNYIGSVLNRLAV